MRNRYSILSGIIGVLALTACHTQRHQVVDTSRDRLLVDARYDARPDAEATAFLAPYRQKVDSLMSPVVGYTGEYMEKAQPEGKLSNLLCDILMWGARFYQEQPDFSVYNMGGIRAALAEGAVTWGDIVDVAPFENKICFLTLTGEETMELFRQVVRRGGEGVSHGVALVMTADGQLVSARLGGKEIDPQGFYRVATLDYLAQGNDGLKALGKGHDVNSPQDEQSNVRYIIREYFKQQTAEGKKVGSRLEGRITIQ